MEFPPRDRLSTTANEGEDGGVGEVGGDEEHRNTHAQTWERAHVEEKVRYEPTKSRACGRFIPEESEVAR